MKLPAIFLILATAACAQESPITACAVLTPGTAASDTDRIQTALNLCNPGRAVVLESPTRPGAFHSAPLILPRGVTLFVNRGVTLYDEGPAHSHPFLFAYQAAYSGIVGAGTIDGQGFPAELVSSYESQGFRLAGVTLRNAAGINAAIYKTTGFSASDLKLDAPPNSTASGLLLSNAVNVDLANLWIRVPGDAMELKASILGPTSNVKIKGLHVFGGRGIAIGDDVFGAVRDVKFDGVFVDAARAGITFNPQGTQGGEAHNIGAVNACLQNMTAPLVAAPAGRYIIVGPVTEGCQAPPFDSAPQPSFTFAFPPPISILGPPGPRNPGVKTVAPGESIQQALDLLPATGGDITLRPGTYREVVTIRKPHVHLHGADPDPTKTVIVFNNTSGNSGGTFNSATVFVEADDVTIDHLSIVNDAGAGKGQAVALHVTGDRAIFRNLRISGAQDTLFAASRYCYGDYGPCVAARQYFADCYIEGNTDFIFGDGTTVFDSCELHGIDTGNVMFTAQSRHTTGQLDSGYIFNHCHLTAKPRTNGVISLGRSWRPYATVVFLRAQIDAPVIPAGWTEWPRFGKPTLPTAFYAEFESTGPGADPKDREPYAHQLSAAEAEQWSPKQFLAGKDGWNPAGVK